MNKYLVQMLINGEWVESLMNRVNIIRTFALDRKVDFLTAIIIYDVSNGTVKAIENPADLVSETEILDMMNVI